METCDGCGKPITMTDASVYVRDTFGKSDFGKTYHSHCLKDPRDERIAELEAALAPFARMSGSYAHMHGAHVIASRGGTILDVNDLRLAAALVPDAVG